MADQATFQRQLGQKIGPLPAVVWLGLVGVAAYLYQRRSGAAPARPETVLPGQSSYYSTISNVNYPPPPGPPPFEDPGPSPAMCPPGTTWGRDPYGDRTSFSCIPIETEDRECPPGQRLECGPGDSPCVCVNIRRPVPIDYAPPPIFGPGRPGGGPEGVELPVRGVTSLDAIRQPAVQVLSLRGKNAGEELNGAVVGQRATGRRRSLRAPLRAAQAATEYLPGPVGLAALEQPMPERGRPAMPPAPALRQRPAPPRVIEDQRAVKHLPAAISG